MNSARNMGRIVGVLLLVQLAGLIVPFVMLHALNAPPGFLQSASQGAGVIRWAMLLLLANGALATGISVLVHSLLRPSSRAMAQWLIVLGATWLALQAVDRTHVMAMLSLSQQYAESAGAPAQLFAILGPVTSASRVAAHYAVLLTIGAWMLVFYGALWRSRLVPSVLPALGVLAAAVHMTGVSLPVFIGYRSVMLVAPVLAVSHGALILWLLSRGFEDRPPA
jgi:hypothetical protein